ncbi:MAG: C39 family peptidase [Thermodesulfobacteriota bacterium]|nr:C39 family peptidase [Thermodesulfobacteriota bacterium]
MSALVAFVIIVSIFTGYQGIVKKPEESININIDTHYGNVRIRHKIKPLSEFKDENIIKQLYDYSCGSAALATVLRYYLGEEVSERQVINGLVRYGDAKMIEKRRGFSLLDMKKFVNVLGYEGVGYKAEIADLLTLDYPFILPIEILNRRHFVVFKGIYKDHVFVADPSLGNMSISMASFKKMWYKDVLFVVYPKGGKGLTTLMLKEEDLRIIDEDMKRRILFHFSPAFTPPAELILQENLGTLQNIRERNVFTEKPFLGRVNP